CNAEFTAEAQRTRRERRELTSNSFPLFSSLRSLSALSASAVKDAHATHSITFCALTLEDKMSKRQHDCASHSLFGRRDFIQAGALGFLGLGLRDYFKLRSVRAAETGEPEISCILLWQSGGASHLDTFDMKPDSPSEIRGPFKPIATNVPGIQI